MTERLVFCHCRWRRVPSNRCERCDLGYDVDDSDPYEDPPLYADGQLAAMDEAALQLEWLRQCSIHDHGVDHLPMGHPTIEDAQARLNWVESEQKARGFKCGPSEAWLEAGDY
jgi:hypothetical protein